MPALNGVPPQLVAAMKQYMANQPQGGTSEELTSGASREGPALSVEEPSRGGPAQTAPGALIDLGTTDDLDDATRPLRGKRGDYLSHYLRTDSALPHFMAPQQREARANGPLRVDTVLARRQDAEMTDPQPRSDAGSTWGGFIAKPSAIDAEKPDPSLARA